MATVKNPVATAQDEFVAQLKGKTNSRRKVVAVGINQTARSCTRDRDARGQRRRQFLILPLRHEQGLRGKVEGRRLVMRFLDRAEVLVANSKVQSKARCDPKVVLHIPGVDLPAVVNVVEAGDQTEVGNSQQERGKCRPAAAGCSRVIGELTAETQVAAGRSRLEDRELLAPNLRAEFEGVPATNPIQVLGEDIAVLQFLRRQKGGATNGGRAVPEVNLRQTAIERTEGHSGIVDTKLRIARDVLVEVQLEAVGVDAVVAQPEFIDEVGGKHVNFAHGDAAVGIFFDPIEESAAI